MCRDGAEASCPGLWAACDEGVLAPFEIKHLLSGYPAHVQCQFMQSEWCRDRNEDPVQRSAPKVLDAKNT